MNHRSTSRTVPPRNAFTMIELVVAASIMIALMSVVTSLTFRIHGVWKDTNQQRIATWAVSSELERITSLPWAEIATALEELEASEELQNALTEPEWSGDFIDDELGPRVALRLDWKRRHPGTPLELVGWVLDTTAKEETSQ
ncbi:type IV pilus modification PilV family protein [Rhodopirellula baltica]|uniref:type IV pilus modification PilV family protein n=1 Tax=Rhodopirellula baltica TaxID=265606 RepID=UPI00055B2674|nr:type II secretion system protein [Rhodopirellula baltica]